METKSDRISLSIYKLRYGLPNLDRIIPGHEDLDSFSIPFESKENARGVLLVRSSPPRHPPWVEFFSESVDISRIPKRKTLDAVLIVDLDCGTFAVPFGHGWTLLEPSSYLPTFGLKVALNSINEKKVRSFDKKTFDAIFRQSREQASKDVSAEDFGVDAERDIIRAVTGKPSRKALGTTITGGRSVRCNPRLALSTLPRFLSRIENYHSEDRYLERFPWIDQIIPVNESELIADLDQLALEQLGNAEDEDTSWLAVPEIIEWDFVEGYKFMVGGRQLRAAELNLEALRGALKKAGRTPQELDSDFYRQHRIKAIGPNGRASRTWSIYECLNSELRLDDDRTFVLSGGSWYHIMNDLIREADRTLDQLQRFEYDFPRFDLDHRDEGSYLSHVAGESSGRLTLMDRKLLKYGGGRSKFELCDLLSENLDFIHVKRYGGSAKLSHLFAQGLVSAELLAINESFRQAANKVLPAEYAIELERLHLPREKYGVTYAIIGPPGGNLSWPAFARVNLKNAIERIRAYRFRVSLAVIETSPERWVLRKK